MLKKLIAWSVNNRFLVLLAAVVITGWGWVALQKTPLDAIPDLSDVQVIIRTSFPGQAPRVVEEQVTYPITTTMLSVPGAQVVRGYSFFGDSYVYVIFKDGTDLYWARARVLEYLNQAAADLPDGVQPRLGPDATGVGWVYSYALVDRTGGHDLAELRSLQDWFLKYELQTVRGVSEVATVGGMVRQYQVVVEPEKLRAYGISLARVSAAIKAANREVGGSVLELAEAEYMVRTRGYLRGLEDLENIPIMVTEMGTPVLLRDIAKLQIGPEMRRVVADLDGEGEVTGGIVVMRYGENAQLTIERVKAKIEQLRQGLPEGVEIIETYDRSALIERAVSNLQNKLIEEFIVVGLVCLVFLFHLRSAFVAIVTLPLGILASFIVMQQQGINANIMSLGGIAIAIGAMVDAAIVMIENAHKHLERYHRDYGHAPQGREHWQVITHAAAEVGPALFFSLLIITLSFLPVFTLEAQEGRLFSPLAYTKTYAMAASAGLSVTLVPVLMGYFIRGRIPAEDRNPLNVFLIWLYRPLLNAVMRLPRMTLLIAVLTVVSLVIPISGVSGFMAPLKWPFQLTGLVTGEPQAMVARIEQAQQDLVRDWRHTFRDTPWLARFADGLGSEFMPELDEGDLMYMPTTLPGLSIGKAQELLQQTDRLIRSVPEVKRVFGKIGRADTATDPAPLTMIETVIQLKPRDQWRPGMTSRQIIEELDAAVQFPGVTNAWVMPIKTRIDMLATGIKTPVGIKVAGPDLGEIERIGRDIEKVVMGVPGTASAYSERVAGGRYIDITPDRVAAARYGLNIDDISLVIAAAVGGINITQTVEGLERYPVNLRFPREQRDDVDKLRALPLVTPTGRADPAGADRRGQDHRRPAHAQERERPAQRLDLRRYPRRRPWQLCGAGAAGGARAGRTAGRLLDHLVRPVRIHAARQCATDTGRSADPGDHLRAAVSDLPARRSGAHGDGLAAVRAGRRLLADLPAGFQSLGRGRRGFHRPGRRGRRVRRDDAGLPRQRVARPCHERPSDARHPARGHHGGCGHAGAAQGDDRGGDRRRPAADLSRYRDGFRGHEPHRCTHDRWHDYGTAAVAVRHPGDLPDVEGSWPEHSG